MHIPDGYLSPATCAVAYAAAIPFWRVALGRVKRAMNSRQIPLLSLFAALSFVIMMFNLPLPGGTTGHATGIGLATVVIGPWAAMIAVSVALIVQALFLETAECSRLERIASTWRLRDRWWLMVFTGLSRDARRSGPRGA